MDFWQALLSIEENGTYRGQDLALNVARLSALTDIKCLVHARRGCSHFETNSTVVGAIAFEPQHVCVCVWAALYILPTFQQYVPSLLFSRRGAERSQCKNNTHTQIVGELFI